MAMHGISDMPMTPARPQRFVQDGIHGRTLKTAHLDQYSPCILRMQFYRLRRPRLSRGVCPSNVAKVEPVNRFQLEESATTLRQSRAHKAWERPVD
jgi:hypothetical protein